MDRIPDTLGALDSQFVTSDLDRRIREADAEEAQRQAKAAILREQFLIAVSGCQGEAPAAFAKVRRDWRTDKVRVQTVAEVLFSALDRGDFDVRAVQILMNAAQGRATQRDAQILLNEVAAEWAQGEAE
jgi:hypothetical protein